MTPKTLNIVVGIDGSDEAREALTTAISLFGDCIGRLTLATVVDYDGGLDNVPVSEQERAQAVLTKEADRVSDLGVKAETVILVGRPQVALARYVRSSGDDLVVIGARGRGATRLLFGSVASSFARGIGVPVAILGPPRPSSTATA